MIYLSSSIAFTLHYLCPAFSFPYFCLDLLYPFLVFLFHSFVIAMSNLCFDFLFSHITFTWLALHIYLTKSRPVLPLPYLILALPSLCSA